MDAQIPIMDGYEATRRIRADLGLLDLPIIAVTAGALSSEQQRAAAAGMNGFIVKPFDASTLISSVMHHASSARGSVGQIHLTPQTTNGGEAWPEIAGIDMQEARNRSCVDPALFRVLLQRFLSDFSDIGVPSSRSGPTSLADRATRLHRLRGGAAILGARAIENLATEAEAACLTGDGPRAGKCLIELANHLDAMGSSAARAFAAAQPQEALTVAPDDVRRESQLVASSRCL